MEVNFLPDPESFDYNWSNWQALIEKQYVTFQRDLITKRLIFHNLEVEISIAREDGKEREFWHIVTRDISKSGSRDGEAQRAVRAHWVRPMIEQHTHAQVTYFNNIHGNGRKRHYFWHQHESYLVILEERAGRLFLVTAYVVDKKYMIGDLLRKHEQWLSSNDNSCADCYKELNVVKIIKNSGTEPLG
jgi:hypothetical protein